MNSSGSRGSARAALVAPASTAAQAAATNRLVMLVPSCVGGRSDAPDMAKPHKVLAGIRLAKITVGEVLDAQGEFAARPRSGVRPRGLILRTFWVSFGWSGRIRRIARRWQASTATRQVARVPWFLFPSIAHRDDAETRVRTFTAHGELAQRSARGRQNRGQSVARSGKDFISRSMT